MKQELLKEMIVKSQTKNDGIYSHKGNSYLVLDKQLAAYVDYFGNVTERAYGFNVSKGRANNRFEGKKVLKSYLLQYKPRKDKQ